MMPKNVVLVGGGAHAVSLFHMLGEAEGKYLVKGYIDKKETSLSSEYLGNDKTFVANKNYSPGNTKLAMCIGVNIELRKKLFGFLKSKGYEFITYIHPAVIASKSVLFSEGSVIFPGVVLCPEVKIGKNVCVHSNAVVEHRSVVGEHTYISPGVSIAGDCCIGNSNLFGINAGLVSGVSLKENTTVGAGAVVLESFGDKGITLIGIPARKLVR